jgi:hypothetical protein
MPTPFLLNDQSLVDAMCCTSCGSKNLGRFKAEMLIHFPGLRNIDRPDVFVFPELMICFDCRSAHFVVPQAELSVLAQDLPAR